jgi:hypothetical protein
MAYSLSPFEEVSSSHYLKQPTSRQEEMLKLPAKAGGFKPPKPRQ